MNFYFRLANLLASEAQESGARIRGSEEWCEVTGLVGFGADIMHCKQLLRP